MGDFVVIQKASTKEHLLQVFDLIKEVAIFENNQDYMTLTQEKFTEDGSGEKPLFHCFVAILDEKVVGFLLYYFIYCTFQGRSVFLEDIYVKEDKRGQGIGQKLYKALAKEAVETNCSKIEMLILKWNTRAIDFHSKMGAIDYTTKEQLMYYRVPREAIGKLCES